MDKIEELFWSEMRAVTVDTWSEEDIEEEPQFATIIADVEARRLSSEVISEAENCLTRDWCSGRVKTAFLTVLARAGELEVYDPNKQWSYRPRTMTIEGVKYVV